MVLSQIALFDQLLDYCACSSAQTRRKEKNRQQDEMLLLDGSRLVPLSAVVIEVAFITATAASIVASWAILLRTEEIRSGHSRAK